MSIADIYNQIRVDDRIATAGQPSADQLQDARAEGFEAVINLAPLDPTKGVMGFSAEADGRIAVEVRQRS